VLRMVWRPIKNSNVRTLLRRSGAWATLAKPVHLSHGRFCNPFVAADAGVGGKMFSFPHARLGEV
jgi:hypothetical protein